MSLIDWSNSPCGLNNRVFKSRPGKFSRKARIRSSFNKVTQASLGEAGPLGFPDLPESSSAPFLCSRRGEGMFTARLKFNDKPVWRGRGSKPPAVPPDKGWAQVSVPAYTSSPRVGELRTLGMDMNPAVLSCQSPCSAA